MKVADYRWVQYKLLDIDLAIGPMIALVAIAFIALLSKSLIELLVRRSWSKSSAIGRGFLRRLFLYPIEIALIPVTSTTAEIFGVSSVATNSIANEIRLVMWMLAGASWLIWFVVVANGVRFSFKDGVERFTEGPYAMTVLSFISILLYSVLCFGCRSTL